MQARNPYESAIITLEGPPSWSISQWSEGPGGGDWALGICRTAVCASSVSSRINSRQSRQYTQGTGAVQQRIQFILIELVHRVHQMRGALATRIDPNGDVRLCTGTLWNSAAESKLGRTAMHTSWVRGSYTRC